MNIQDVYKRQGDAVAAANHHQQQAEHDHAARPDVGRKVQGIGLERLAVVLGGNPAERARTPEIDAHRNEHHGKGGDAGFNIYVAEEQTLGRFIDDPNASQQQQTGLDECGKIFYLAVAVLMLRVGRFVGDSNGKQRDDGSDQIQDRMGRF